MLPLTMARTGETDCIKRITGKDETRRHLADLGFIEGESVTLISEIAGNVILNIRGTRIALDKTMAGRIMI